MQELIENALCHTNEEEINVVNENSHEIAKQMIAAAWPQDC